MRPKNITLEYKKLKPGATYIYERVDGVVYAREMGAAASERFEIGHDFDPRTRDGRPLVDHLRDNQLWSDIRRAAETNEELRQELDRVKMFYYLSKPYGSEEEDR